MVCLMIFMHTSTCTLLWWWYDEVMALSVFSCLQNCSEQSDMKFMPDQIILFGSQKFCKYNLGLL